MITVALEKLPDEDLQALGIRKVGEGDQVIIKATAGDIEKLVDALMADEE